MASYRIEKDLLGEREIREDVYYGIQTQRALENFPITGYKPHKNLIIALAHIKKAAAQANYEVGRLNKKIADAIVMASDEILSGKFHDQFVVDVIQGGAGTSFNMNANEVIANRAIELLGGKKGDYLIVSPNTHVNMAQSTNDVFPTAIRLSCLSLADGVVQALNNLVNALKEKEEEFNGILKMGRTHLQDAVPIRLGQEFGAYARLISRDIKRIKNTLEELKEINMGATAIGTGLNADPQYIDLVVRKLRENTGFDLYGAENLVDATQNTDSYVHVSSALKICAVNLSKIANDLRLLASGPKCGFNEINLPPVQPGSSIMPGKVNPVMAEVVNQVAFQIIGNDHTISLASEAGQLELNVMEPVLTFNLLQSLEILRNVVTVFTEKCVKGITANIDRCQELVQKSIGIVTAINPHVGYETASQVAKEALATGRSVREIVLERGILTEEELEIILNPYEMTKPGIAGKELLDK
ncbi:aspartate ammonia-lyase [Anaerobranca californiensis DSM 14826]|uniref:Aspartate ammonia-lyase n=1 Tax=Anaerobranca californiensis DSM 14826 TaxID=1120989 RepID=A0A1M6NL90_9FIRM|nr:aspartate ammonia-lyase [Anaerobranca californiensis]SHJ96493.1 aspartate ammonia-lyase [Anaerobranca californiensis DSM 14826]